jgi:phenylacetate-CoA ligase
MLDTALAQLRFAASLVFGLPFAPWSLDRIINGLRATQHEFGPLVTNEMGLLGKAPFDDETRREMQWRCFRTQAKRGARETAYYGRLFAELGLDPAHLQAKNITCLPLTSKAALRESADAFVCKTANPYLQSMTTGTTGRPTSIYFSAHDLRVIAALTAIGFLVRGEVGAADIVHISTSSRATLGNAS